jgi:hypothetical protein
LLAGDHGVGGDIVVAEVTRERRDQAPAALATTAPELSSVKWVAHDIHEYRRK